MNEGDVKSITVAPGNPEHDELLDRVQAISDRVKDMLEGVDVNDAIGIAEALVIFAGSIVGKARLHDLVSDQGLEKLRHGSVVNFNNAIQGELDNAQQSYHPLN